MMQLITSNCSSGAGYSPWIAPSTPLEDVILPLQSSKVEGEAAEESAFDVIDILKQQREAERKSSKSQYQRIYWKRKAEEAAIRGAVCVICGSQSSSRWLDKGTTCLKCYEIARKVKAAQKKAIKGTILPANDTDVAERKRRIVACSTCGGPKSGNQYGNSNTCRKCYEIACKVKAAQKETMKGVILPANDTAVAENAPLIGRIRPLTIEDFL